jgi:hypothetical protein
LPSCVVNASPDIARRAGRAFWVRKWRTRFGAFALASIICVIATIVWMVALFGWERAPLGVPATVLCMMMVAESVSFFGVPRTLARSASGRNTSEVHVEDDGITVKAGRNTQFLPWKTFSAVWIYGGFVLLPIGRFAVSRFVWIPTAGMSAEVLQALASASKRLANSR